MPKFISAAQYNPLRAMKSLEVCQLSWCSQAIRTNSYEYDFIHRDCALDLLICKCEYRLNYMEKTYLSRFAREDNGIFPPVVPFINEQKK